MKQFDNVVRRQVYSIEQMMHDMLPAMKVNVKEVTQTIRKPGKIILTGCGDCYCAALSVKEYIAEWLQTPVEVVTSLELARHYPAFALSADTLVVLMSKSGGAARVVEAAKRMTHYGVQNIALTAKAESALAHEAQHVLELAIPSFESGPGVRSYTAMLMGIYLLAAALCEQFGQATMTVAHCADGIVQTMAKVSEILPQWDALAFSLANDYKDARSAEFIGGGSDLGSAWYAQAKVYETVGLPASYLDCEDWFHINYFAADRANILTMIFDHKKSASAGRTRELLTKLELMGMPVAVVTDDATIAAKYVFTAPCTEEWLTPFCQYAVGPMVAAYLARINEQPFNCGFSGAWARNPEAPSTTNSKIEII
ncbi:MAG: SIS domain-containing protein [Angelakisella sp.]